ncbi:hypothetical protein E3N88_39928 [Mikania micrantha]|uniref:C2 domain-containing protein n=1 Tax=Mikania micrantha TaxID=192012 RepID=A0A5N6LM16_9ASTR|nr:hypothetical protein E3N88_39928 [Mikania micrantha]
MRSNPSNNTTPLHIRTLNDVYDSCDPIQGGIDCTCQTVYDHDMLSKDDPMGDAELEIKSFLDALKMPRLERHPNGTVLKRIPPSRTNNLAEESCIIWKDKEVIQQLSLRLRNVETGEVEVELHWVHDPSTIM